MSINSIHFEEQSRLLSNLSVSQMGSRYVIRAKKEGDDHYLHFKEMGLFTSKATPQEALSVSRALVDVISANPRNLRKTDGMIFEGRLISLYNIRQNLEGVKSELLQKKSADGEAKEIKELMDQAIAAVTTRSPHIRTGRDRFGQEQVALYISMVFDPQFFNKSVIIPNVRGCQKMRMDLEANAIVVSHLHRNIKNHIEKILDALEGYSKEKGRAFDPRALRRALETFRLKLASQIENQVECDSEVAKRITILNRHFQEMDEVIKNGAQRRN